MSLLSSKPHDLSGKTASGQLASIHEHICRRSRIIKASQPCSDFIWVVGARLRSWQLFVGTLNNASFSLACSDAFLWLSRACNGLMKHIHDVDKLWLSEFFFSEALNRSGPRPCYLAVVLWLEVKCPICPQQRCVLGNKGRPPLGPHLAMLNTSINTCLRMLSCLGMCRSSSACGRRSVEAPVQEGP